MKKVFVFLADGFEEIEAITVIDMLRRAEIPTQTVSISDTKEVKGAHNVIVMADELIGNIAQADAAAIVLPGGMPGSTNLKNSEALKQIIIAQNDDNAYIAAICAAPIVLANAGVLEGRKATCYPSFETQLVGATHLPGPVVIDDNIVTAHGPASASAFALALIELLKCNDDAEEVAKGMLLI